MNRLDALDLKFLKDNCQKIHMFGLGFIQVKIDDASRVHFYTQRFGQTADEELHNHRYDFTSQIMKGELWQSLYEVSHPPFACWGEWRMINEACDPTKDKPFSPLTALLEPKLTCRQRLAAGSSYWLRADQFHRVTAIKDTITLVQRGPITKGFAQVVHHIDKPPVCPFSIRIGEDKLWATVEEMLS